MDAQLFVLSLYSRPLLELVHLTLDWAQHSLTNEVIRSLGQSPTAPHLRSLQSRKLADDHFGYPHPIFGCWFKATRLHPGIRFILGWSSLEILRLGVNATCVTQATVSAMADSLRSLRELDLTIYSRDQVRCLVCFHPLQLMQWNLECPSTH